MKKLIDSLRKYKIPARGVVHIGAHQGQEAEQYDKIGFEKVIWFEANPEIFCLLVENLKTKPHHLAFQSLLSDKDGDEVDFYVTANYGHSSSILEPLKEVGGVSNILKLKSSRFDKFVEKNNIGISACNVLNLDVQGAEKKVLLGMGQYLNNFDIIISEINLKTTYKGAVLFHELDSLFMSKGYVRIYTSAMDMYGEAGYINCNLINKKLTLFNRYWHLFTACFIELLVFLHIAQFFSKRKNLFFVSPIKSLYHKLMLKD